MFTTAEVPRAFARAAPGRAPRGRGRGSSRVPMRTNHKFTSKIISQPGPRASRDADAVSVAAPPNEQARNREKEKRIQRRRETSSSRSFDSIDCSIDEDAVAGPNESKSNPPVQLLRNYDMVIETILSEMNRTQSGDRVEFSVYVLERTCIARFPNPDTMCTPPFVTSTAVIKRKCTTNSRLKTEETDTFRSQSQPALRRSE